MLLHPKTLFGQYCRAESSTLLHNGEKKAIYKRREAGHITLKSIGLPFREIARKAKVSGSTIFLHLQKAWELEETLSGRGLADPSHSQHKSIVNSLRDRLLTGQQHEGGKTYLQM